MWYVYVYPISLSCLSSFAYSCYPPYLTLLTYLTDY